MGAFQGTSRRHLRAWTDAQWEIAQEMTRRGPKARVIEFADVGHAGPHEQGTDRRCQKFPDGLH